MQIFPRISASRSLSEGPLQTRTKVRRDADFESARDGLCYGVSCATKVQQLRMFCIAAIDVGKVIRSYGFPWAAKLSGLAGLLHLRIAVAILLFLSKHSICTRWT